MSTNATVELLRQQLAARETPPAAGEALVVPSGCEGFDRFLPDGGWRRGSLVEWLIPGAGSGTLAFALATAKTLWSSGSVVIVDRRREFFPPAAAAWGLPLARTILVRPANEADERWAWEQALLAPGVAVVWGTLDRLAPRDFRRLQLAAEAGKAIGFVFRPAERRGEPSWSHVQLQVRPTASGPTRTNERQPDRWRWQVERTRGSGGRNKIEVEIDEAGNAREVTPDERAVPVRPISPVADSATCPFPA